MRRKMRSRHAADKRRRANELVRAENDRARASRLMEQARPDARLPSLFPNSGLNAPSARRDAAAASAALRSTARLVPRR